MERAEAIKLALEVMDATIKHDLAPVNAPRIKKAIAVLRAVVLPELDTPLVDLGVPLEDEPK